MEHAVLAWSDVDAAFGYKLDCLTFDMIYIALCDRGGEVRVHISEEDAGYEVLIQELAKRVPGFPRPDDWFARVAFPAFKTNWTELFRRQHEDRPV